MICHLTHHWRRNIHALILFLSLLFAPTLILAQSFEIKYKASNDHFSAGWAYWSLTQDGSGWKMRLTTAPNRLARVAGVGKIAETAVLTSPIPPFNATSFSHINSKRESKNFTTTLAEAGKIVVERTDQTTTVPVTEGIVIDRLSVILTVASELQTNPQFEKLTFKVLDRHGARDMVFNNLGKEKINFQQRNVEAYVVESRRPGSSRKTKTWFSNLNELTDDRLLPIKIEQYKNKKLVLRLSLSKFTSL